jgi:hypothetical protein
MYIFVQSITGRRVRLDVEPGDQVQHVIGLAQKKLGASLSERRICLKGRTLRPKSFLYEYCVAHNSVLTLTYSLRLSL